MKASSRLRQARMALLLAPLLLCTAAPTEAQTTRPVGRDAALGLRFQELRFDPPQLQKRTLKSGVSVFFMEDHSLPLVTLYARFRGGYALLPRSSYAAATALSGLLRTGGTTVLPPDSVDYLLDFYALQMTFGGGGQSTFTSVNTLTKHLGPAVELWTDILRNPRFDSLEVEIWRDRQLESTRRRPDNPGYFGGRWGDCRCARSYVRRKPVELDCLCQALGLAGVHRAGIRFPRLWRLNWRI